ncbi:MAG: hypothetical protein NT120_05235 [Candidatus Aenigmarchaeota archaeon]|nr:hypothetical protein [Candidatus Aenigmarchaeota archaeon]
MKTKKLVFVFYIILIIILVIAFAAVNIYKGLKVKDGFCYLPEDCDKQKLVHIQCVGNWTCEKNACGFICKSDVEQKQQGDLSGATVECIEDSNCQPGVCQDNTTYKRYSCQANKCTDINYFADPCKFR